MESNHALRVRSPAVFQQPRRICCCEGGNRTHLGPVNSRVPDRQASSQSPSRCGVNHVARGFLDAHLGRWGAVGVHHTTRFSESAGGVRARARVPLVKADGCQSWVRTRAFRVRAGDPSTGPTGKAHDHQGMSCRTWIRTRASRVKAGHPHRWTIRQRRGHHCPRPAPRARSTPVGSSRGERVGPRGT